MTAEDKLKEWFKECAETWAEPKDSKWGYREISCITPEHIDLIANLVVERLKNVIK